MIRPAKFELTLYDTPVLAIVPENAWEIDTAACFYLHQAK